MCCGESENKRGHRTYARNIKKPSMFLSSLIVKRRDNRRTSKPNMLLDAVLTNAIRNIKKDKTITKLTSLSTIKKFKNHRNKTDLSDGCRNPSGKSKSTGKDDIVLKDEEKNSDLIEYLAEVDNFFKELNNVKVKNDPKVHYANDNCFVSKSNDLSNVSGKTPPPSRKQLSNDDLIESFIETGIVL